MRSATPCEFNLCTGHKFDFNDEFTTAFYPLVESQCKDYASRENDPKLKSKLVYLHFEKRYGKLFSPSNYTSSSPSNSPPATSPTLDAYCYDTGKDYRIMQTSSLIMSMILDGKGENGLVDVFQKPLIILEKVSENIWSPPSPSSPKFFSSSFILLLTCI